MKKLGYILVAVIIAVSVCACAKSQKTANGKNSDEANQTEQDLTKSSQTSENSKPDIDLTALSTTMAYSQVADITNNIANYEGKTVKIKGVFLVEETEQRNYYACHISDVTACCSVGFEFRLKDTSKVYPADYPDVNSEITVTGRLSSYKEGDNTYVELLDAELL